MSTYIFSNERCRECTARRDGICYADVDGGYMVHPETGEIMGRAEVLHQDHMGRVWDVCESIASYWGYYCEDDCEYHEDAIFNQSDGYRYSPDYAERFLEQCRECGDWYDPEDLTHGYCESCRDYRRGMIGDYHSGRRRGWDPVGDYDDPKKIGLEIETDGDDYEPERAAAELYDEFGDVLVFEEDCSLYNGLEIVTQPHTLDAMRNFDFDVLVATCLSNYADEAPGSAGYHMHFSRAWFGSTKDEQDETIARVICAYRNNWEALLHLSGRQEWSQVDNYAAMPAGGDDVDEILYCNGRSRYYAVNITNRATVEFRLGAGVLDASFLRDWIELHVQIIEAARRGDKIIIEDDCIYRPAA